MSKVSVCRVRQKKTCWAHSVCAQRLHFAEFAASNTQRKTARTGLGFIAILDSFQRLAAKDITMTTKVKWGIMSTATIVDKILDAMQKAEGCELVAVASRSTEK
jgi:hypothetical protein